MTDKKLNEQNHNILSLKRLSIPEQYQHNCGNNETSHSYLSSSTTKHPKLSSPFSYIMNMKNPLTAFNYLPIFRPMPFEMSQSFIKNQFNGTNAQQSNQQIDSNSLPYSTVQSTNFYEEPVVIKINIPIEMIVRNMPQQFSSSFPEKRDYRCNHSANSWYTIQTPHQTSSDYTSKPTTSLNNGQGDICPKSIRHTDVSVFDPRMTNEMNKSLVIQHEQQAKNLHKSFQESQHYPTMSQNSNSSSFSYPTRCECRSTLYPSK